MFRPDPAPSRSVIAGLLLGVALVACACSRPDSETDSGVAGTAARSEALELPSFLTGADISFLPELEDHGVRYLDGEKEKDLLQLLRDHGYNAIRLKLWHTPEAPYNTLEQVLAMARRIEDAGMVFLLDFHYSDS